MIKVVEQMLQSYAPKSLEERKNAIKEVMQEIALCGLSRAGFFDKAVFYGGTALRIFHELDRFSEDLDFSLREPDPVFSLREFLPILEREVQSFGLNMSVQSKQKLGNPDIKTAFMKGDAREHLLQFFPDADLITGTPAGERFRSNWRLTSTHLSLLDLNTHIGLCLCHMPLHYTTSHPCSLVKYMRFFAARGRTVSRDGTCMTMSIFFPATFRTILHTCGND